MNIQRKINYTITGSLLLFAVTIVFSGVLLINAILNNMYDNIMQSKLEQYVDQITQSWKLLEDNNLLDWPDYVKKAQDDILETARNYKLDNTGRIIVVSIDDKKIIYPQTLHDKDMHQAYRYMIDDGHGKKVFKEDGVSKYAVYKTFPGWRWLVVLTIDTSEKYSHRTNYLATVSLLTFFFLILSIVVIMYVLKKSVITPLRSMTTVADNLAEGDISHRYVHTSDDEIGTLSDAFHRMQISLEKKISLANEIGRGNLIAEVEITSPNDFLGKAMQNMLRTLKDVVRQARQIALGDYTGRIEPKSEKDEMAETLNKMTEILAVTTSENQIKDWIKTGQSGLYEAMRGQKDLNTLAKDTLSFFCRYIEASLGAIYLFDEKETLSLIASYAFSDRGGNFNRFKIGEGLVGQAGLEQATIFFNSLTKDAPTVNFGIAEKIPSYIMVAPVCLEKKLIAVILMGAEKDFTEVQRTLINESIENIAIGFITTISRQRTENLLIMTKRQSERLQQQQEELRQKNEELEQQTLELRESEAKLQSQQEELRVTNEELEERTKDLEDQKNAITQQNQQLEVAREELKKKAADLEVTSKYKSEFLANMSHELRTPLNSILVLSQLLNENKAGTLTAKQLEFSSTIHTAGSDLLNLINDILDLSKIESGKMEVLIEDMELERFADRMRQLFEHVAMNKNLKMIVDIAEDTPATIANDSQKVQQIVKNLLSNAFKFTHEGAVSLCIGPAPANVRLTRLQAKDAVEIKVKDTGIGIPEDKQALIFEAFQQADGTTSRKYGGTGLGLSISKELAHLLGGEIVVASKVGEGSSFALYLPKTSMAKVLPQKTMESKPQAEEPIMHDYLVDDRNNLTKQDKSILIIEDDQNFAKVLRDLAHDKGFKCLVSDEGENGLHLADYYQPSAIVLDIGLPGINGWQVMEKLKANPRTSHIPVHFISAADKPMDALKMGAIGYLTKPASLDALDSTFKKIEDQISRPVKNLLIIEDNKIQRESIIELIGSGDVKSVGVESPQEALGELNKTDFDCIILDLGLRDASGYDLLATLKSDAKYRQIPVIIYTGKELSREEEEKLQKYSESIIIKGARSPERLLADTSLFLHRVESSLDENQQNMLKKAHNREAELAGRKVLLVDDDMRNVFALSSVLEGKELDIVVARNGREALKKLEEVSGIDIVLMDIMMPEMDGYEAMKHIRGNGKFSSLPIIALTAKAMKGDRTKCIEAGANDYIAKPIDTEKLLSLMRVWLQK